MKKLLALLLSLILVFSFTAWCHGVNDNGMLTDPSLPETQIRKVAINKSKKSVFLCDESKFSLSTPYNLMHIEDVDYIITDSDTVNQFIKEKGKIIIV